ncbi:MAG: hypothetical protein K6C94_04195 [Candidatus Gastranaerophilales bacterium]|nr:hypothetical protein [Candidatus Gastranaerophilales bacterium]
MLSGAEFNSKVSKTMLNLQNIESRGGGGGNLVVDGKGDGKVHSEADETVVLIADGDDFVELDSDFNQLEIQGGSNRAVIRGNNNFAVANFSENSFDSKGDENVFLTDNGNNEFKSIGNNNAIVTDHGNTTIQSGGNNNVIYTNHGNSKIQSGGDNNDITAINGNQTIFSSGYNLATEEFTGNGNNNTIRTGGGNDYVDSTGHRNTILTSGGNDIVNSVGDDNKIGAASGNNKIFSDGNNNSIKTGAGHDAVLALGNGSYFDLGDGDNDLVFYGNDIEFHLGDGDNRVQTLDYAIMNEDENSPFNYGQYEDRLKPNTTIEVLTDKVGEYHEYSDINYDFSEGDTTTTGSSSSQSGNVVTTTFTTTVTHTETTDASAMKHTVNRFSDIDEYHFAGVRNVKGTIGTGSNNMMLNVAENLKIDGQTYQKDENGQYVNNNTKSKNNIFVTGEIVSIDYSSLRYHNEEGGDEQLKYHNVDIDRKTTSRSTSRTINSDPIIVDFNRDGKITFYEAPGVGLDVNNDGIGDGFATSGDKMLAMSDINGNGIIDGSEAFGDHTVSPFTGNKLNAKDGFDALRLVATEAEQRGFTGCIKDGIVDLVNLRAALATVGVDLGFISDNNITKIEDLAHVAKINVLRYSGRTEGSGEIQIGSYIDNTGAEHKALDVWAKT